jgi:hypothetical protein
MRMGSANSIKSFVAVEGNLSNFKRNAHHKGKRTLPEYDKSLLMSEGFLQVLSSMLTYKEMIKILITLGNRKF